MALMLALLVACGGSHTTAPAEVAPAAPVATPGPTERVTVTLDPGEMSYDEAKNRATFSPGSRRQAADYTTYELDLASLEAALGGRPTEPVTVVLEVGPPTVERSTPSDPNLPAPMGGFTYTTYVGKVVSRAP